MDDNTRRAALDYHRYPQPGKLRIEPTKRMVNQRDLALAYSPGVAAPCVEIAADPHKALDYTARGNLVAVISNGTAVLGLGAIGALASKPVMEGKAVLFKKFADIDVFDIEVDTTDTDAFVEAVALLEPTFGGINLEDIKAPECFEIERRLKERMNIPVFHDDQHGTAIVVAAAVRALAQLPDAQLLLVGKGPDEPQLRALAGELGVAERVHFLGLLDHDLLPLVLSAADAMVLPSASEGLANAWVEALACGTPLVICDVGGARELVRGPAAGVLVARNSDAVAEGVRMILRDPPAPRDTAQMVERFGWAEHAEALDAIYSEIIRR